MSNEANNSNARSHGAAGEPSDRQDAMHLASIEGPNDAVGAVDASTRAMREQRAALRAALKADFARPLSSTLTARFEQSVRDELDCSLLANLATGRPLEDHLPVSTVVPVRPGMFAGARRVWEELRFSRSLAAAAMLVIAAGASWLAMRPATQSSSPSPLATKSSTELPQWAVLPNQPKAVQQDLAKPSAAAEKYEAIAVADVRETRDINTALEWTRQGVLAIRIVSDSPRRDRERLSGIVSDARKRSWQLSASTPVGFDVIPSRPWPIDQTLVDADGRSAQTSTTPLTATVAGFDGTLRPDAEALQSLRDELERNLSCTVIFERVDNLRSYANARETKNVPTTAADVVWWTKPASEWNHRVHVPVVLEFGSRTPGK